MRFPLLRRAVLAVAGLTVCALVASQTAFARPPERAAAAVDTLRFLAPTQHVLTGLVDLAVAAPEGTTRVRFSLDGIRIAELTDLYAVRLRVKPYWRTVTDAAWFEPGQHELRAEADTPAGVVAVQRTVVTVRPPAPPGTWPLTGGWQFVATPGSPIRAMGPPPLVAQPSYDAGAAPTVLVPSSLGAVDDQWNDWQGITGVYRRTIDLPEPSPGERTWIVVESCYFTCGVFVNGVYVGETRGGYLPTRLDVTTAIRPGANLLAVAIDHRQAAMGPVGMSAQPAHNTFHGLYWNWGGLLQPLRLERTPAIALTGVTAAGSADGRITLRAETVNPVSPGAHVRALVDVTAPGRTPVVRRLPVSFVAPAGGGESDPVVVTVPRPKLWSLHQPQLYRVTVTPQGAAAWRPLVVRTGLRDVTVRGGEVLLNGRPLRRLPGINRHHDYPGLGRTVPDGLARRDLRELRARGYRIFRPGHYPSTPGELDAADSLGLLVIEEINVSSLAGRVLNSQPVREFASAQLTGMIRRDRGHPSVVAWSVGNENRVDEPGGVDYVRDIVGLGRSLDPTRLYTQVSALHGRDPTYQFQDLVSINAYAGWYAGRAAGVAPLLDQIARVTRGRPMLVAEYGAEADPHYGVDGKGSERYQSCLVDEYRRVLAPKRGLMAQMVWTFTDFWRDPENGGGNPRQIQPFSSKGLISYDRRPKLAWRTAFSPVRIVEPHRVVVPLGRYSRMRVPIVVEAVGRRSAAELRITAPRGFSVTPERVRFTVGARRKVIWVTLDGLLPVGTAHASGVVRAIVNRTTEAHPQSLTVVAQGSAGPNRVGCR